MKYDVISVGSATLDVFTKSPELKLLKTDKVFTGEAIMAPYGAKCEVSKLVVQSGGGGTNTAVGFARLGLRAAVLARCGTDFASQIIKSELEAEKVDTSLLVQVKGDETDYSTILIGPDGGRTILVYRGGTRLEEKLVDFKKLSAKWFYVSSVEGNLGFLKKLVDFANKEGIKVVVNPGRKELAQKGKLIPILNKVEVVIVNREEAARLTGATVVDDKVFMNTCLLVREIAVITDGSRGVRLCSRDERVLQSDGFKVEPADSTGAGDAFGAGFIAGLVMGWDLEEALKLGVCNGASAVTKIGAKTGMLRTAEVEKWMRKRLEIGWLK
jgi:ribokinase